MKYPRHDDGKRYSGECLCCGVIVTGTVARSAPKPFLSHDLFGSSVRCVLLSTNTGAHDVPLVNVKEVTA